MLILLKITYNQFKIMRIQLLIVYKLACLILLFFCFSCDPNTEDQEYIHKLQVENASNLKLSLLAYDTFDETANKPFDVAILKKEIIIDKHNVGPIVINKNIFSTIDNSTYFAGLQIDSLIIKFEDNRGYYSKINRNSNDIYVIDYENWILNKSTLFSVLSKDVRKEGDMYIYTITQEDYENAHVLP